MAQYFQVLNQGDKSPSDDGSQYYQDDAAKVQYVIAPNSQQFQRQQIVVSGERLMLVEGQSQQLIVDQPPVFQQQTEQYIIQDSRAQQVFYMENSSPTNVETTPPPQPPQQQQPIVLNHQVGTAVSRGIIAARSGKVNVTVSPSLQMQQVRPQVPTRVSVVPSSRPPLHQQIQQHLQRQQQLNQAKSSPPMLLKQPQLQQQQPAQQQQLQVPQQQQQQVQQPAQQQQQLLQQQLHQQRQQQLLQLKNQPNMRPTNNQIQSQSTGQVVQMESDINLPDGSLVSMGDLKEIMNKQKGKNDEIIETSPKKTPRKPAAPRKPRAKKDPNAPKPPRPARTPNPNKSRAKATPKAKAKNILDECLEHANLKQSPSPTPNQSQNQFSSPHQLLQGSHPLLNQQNIHQQAQPQIQQQRQVQNPHQIQQPQQVRQPQQIGQQPPRPLPQQPQPQQHHQVTSSTGPTQVTQTQYQIQHSPQAQHQSQRPNQAQYMIQPNVNSRPQQRRPLPPFIPSSQIQQIIESTPVCEEYSDSIRMLVLLANGEQRLITFTLPKEACTIQEILEQVNVPFQHDTHIEVIETNSNGINYIVTVGNVPNFHMQSSEDQETKQHQLQQIQQQHAQLQQQVRQGQQQNKQQPMTPKQPSHSPSQSPALPSSQPTEELLQEATPEPNKEEPKYVPGKLAVCNHCGYLSEDFNRCCRCKRKLPETVKSVPAPNHLQQSLLHIQQQLSQAKANGPQLRSHLQGPLLNTKKKSKPKAVDQDPVVLTLSSDDEDAEGENQDNCKSSRMLSAQLLEKLGSSISLHPVQKDNSNCNAMNNSFTSKVTEVKNNETTSKVITLYCRTIRIGSYRFVPQGEVTIDESGISMNVPHPKKEKDIKTIKIAKADIHKVVACFQKQLPVIFYCVRPSYALILRNILDMKNGSDIFFNPLAEEESQKYITLLPEVLSDEVKVVFNEIYSKPYNLIDEVNTKEANEMLIKSCPKDLTKGNFAIGNYSDVKLLFTYPPEGRGRISVNTEDYLCLAQDQFLNDVIIDFYIKYVVDNLPKAQQEKVHAFSTFFYKRLTTKPMKASRKLQPAEVDPTLSASQKRHARVQKWTKNVNLFEKDFIIVPINENCHWFLAIICFPAMDGAKTLDGDSIKIETRKKKDKKLSAATNATPGSNSSPPGNTPLQQVEKPILCDDPDVSDKDEAEGDESELESDDSEELPAPETPLPASITISAAKRRPIRQPCILIFDSLSGSGRSRVVATLRDYLTCEYRVKMNAEREFNKDVIKGACPKVPQQTNFTDCGLYLLQYVEHFFKQPIKDYYMPIKELKEWFDEITVTKKREDISLLIKELMIQSNRSLDILPDIMFPTLNGKLVEHHTEAEEEEEEEEEMCDEEDEMDEDVDDEMMPEPETEETIEAEMRDMSKSSASESELCANDSGTSVLEESQVLESPMKLSCESRDEFETQQIKNCELKPDIREFPRTTDRDTLSYLKAKRIIRHKNSDGPELKKPKGLE